MIEDKKEKKLAVKAIHGNAEAYGELILEYKDYLYRTAMLSVKNQEIALDMVSECILSGFRSVHSLKNPAYFKTWITRVLRNTIADYYRSERYSENLDDMQIAADDGMVSSEEKLDLYQAIDLLSEKYKTVIILKYFNELKI
ncbi:MAG: sigma-70 family RNA polymerase sigma factor, partial [Clostridium sp.]|nr:sigma-70 family RNA polymerase sigma factor [Clostridium sp.]